LYPGVGPYFFRILQYLCPEFFRGLHKGSAHTSEPVLSAVVKFGGGFAADDIVWESVVFVHIYHRIIKFGWQT
jgi:hypothetical protein